MGNTFQTIIIFYSKVIDIAVEILSIPVRAICLLFDLFAGRDTSLPELFASFPKAPANNSGNFTSFNDQPRFGQAPLICLPEDNLSEVCKP